MSAFDPRAFGALEADVESLKRDDIPGLKTEIADLRKDLQELTALLQQARGGWTVARWVIGTAFASGAAIMAYIQAKLP